MLAEPLRTGDYHGWYGLPRHISEWSCTNDYVFVVTTDENYYPFLQELSFIRPLRMMSPNMFVGGAASDPLTQNSCHTGWGTITESGVTVQCAGMVGGGVSSGGDVSGTGRWKYVKTVPQDSSGGISEIHFAINPNHWDVPPDGITDVILKHYPTTDSVRDALMDGSLDAVIGGGVLSEADIALFKYNNSASVSVSLTESIQNRIIVFNTNRTPTDDLQNRKVIIHAIDKAKIIDEEFAGLADVAESLFPKNAPYCGADLTPKPDYDIEKAQLLNCPTEPEILEISTERKKTELSKAVIAVIAILCVAFITVGVVLAFMYTREKAGNPLFQPLNPSARSDEPDMESNSYEVKM